MKIRGRERGNNDRRQRADGGPMDVEPPTPPPHITTPPSPYTLSLPPFSFSAYSLHQDAIIQDISEEELKALTVEGGPGVLSESADTQTHTHARAHILTTQAEYSLGEVARGGIKKKKRGGLGGVISSISR